MTLLQIYRLWPLLFTSAEWLLRAAFADFLACVTLDVQKDDASCVSSPATISKPAPAPPHVSTVVPSFSVASLATIASSSSMPPRVATGATIPTLASTDFGECKGDSTDGKRGGSIANGDDGKETKDMPASTACPVNGIKFVNIIIELAVPTETFPADADGTCSSTILFV